MRTITVLANVAWVALTVIFVIVFLAIGVFLVAFPFKEFSVESFISQHTALTMIIGILMIGMFLKYLVVMWLRTRKEDCIAFDNPDGEVIIAVHAVEESVKNLVESFEDVRTALPSVVAADDGVNVEVKVTLWDDSNIHAVSERIQGATKSHIQSFFGLANVNTVKVFITATASRTGGAQPAVDFGEGERPDEKVGGGSPDD